MDLDAGVEIMQAPAQSRNQNVQRIAVNIVVESVNLFEKLVAQYDAAGVSDKRFKQRELSPVKHDGPAADDHLMGRQIERQAAKRDRGRRVSARTPETRPDSRHQFIEIARLRQIIISAGVKPANPIGDRLTCSQDQNPDSGLERPHPGKKLKSVPIGQTPIHEGERVFVARQGRARFIERADMVCNKSRPSQSHAKRARQLRLVLD